MRMTHYLTAGLAALTIMASPALADGRGKGQGQDRGHIRVQAPQAGWNCPPGLAKKNPPCVPPGQARKATSGFDVGDILSGDRYIRIRNPDRYDLDLDPSWRYLRDGDTVYRVDRDTGRILAIMNLLNAF